ncbi:MAG: branched-chain amino acid ABC transporter permease [Alphaproteobacteria bacterium]
MNFDIALILAQDGIANGAIYVLVALGTVLIFAVSRVIFVPFGDVAAYAALTLASFQLGRTPGTIWLVMTLAGIALIVETITLLRNGEAHRIPRSLFMYGVLPMLPVALVFALGSQRLPMAAEIALALALVMPIAPLLYRIVFQPLADASVLVLLIVAVALHFLVSGLALLFFGPEGFRTEPLTRAAFEIGSMTITAQSVLIVVACIVFSLLLFLFFDRTMAGKALRATAVNRTGARLVGIRPAKTAGLAFLIASALAGISGILIAPVTTLYYDSGFIFGLKAFVGAIIGGLTSYPIAALGAVFVGLLESYASFWDSALKEVVVFSLLIPVLLWRSLAFGHVEEEPEEEDEGSS